MPRIHYSTPAGTPMPFAPLIVANYYVSPACGDQFGGASAIPPNTMRAQFYPCMKTATYDRIGAHVQALDAAGNWRLGIYADNGAGYPGALIQDAGAISTAAAVLTSIALVPNVQLIAGRNYWLVALSNTNIANIYYDVVPGYVYPYLGHDTGLQNPYLSIQVDQAYGALPDPFTAAGTYLLYGWALGLRLLSVP